MADSEMDLRAEIARLNKIIEVLMDRVENNLSLRPTTYFGLFQGKIVLENQVRQRTLELNAALREIEKINRVLKESEAKFRAVLDQSLVGIVITEQGSFSYVNPKFTEIFGYSEDELAHIRPIDLAIEEDRPLVSKQLRKAFAGRIHEVRFTFRGTRKDGAAVHVEVAGSPPTRIAGHRSIIAVVTDITERVRVEKEMQALQAQLREQAVHDPLTGLLNRRALEASLGRELIRAARHGDPLSLVICDIDRFKSINDTHGHQAGDEVLKTFAGLLNRATRSGDICCRYGGEEFVLVCPRMTLAKAAERAEQLRETCAALPFDCGDAVLQVTASFGVAAFPRHGDTGDLLIRSADRALYAAKNAGRNQVKCYADTESGEFAWAASRSNA